MLPTAPSRALFPLPDRWTLLRPGLTVLCRVLGVVCVLVAIRAWAG